ncbi:hypothetical protein KW797_02550 [Candidatus Parcubacteria bacterium]|nr:hypothetical protein [Candidatus Parcubacteria bacterium]
MKTKNKPLVLLSEAITRVALALIPDGADVSKFGLSETQKEEALRQFRYRKIRDAAAKKDILKWGKLLFGFKFPLGFCPELHEYFVDIRRAGFTGTEAPRGTAKTTIRCFLIPLFQALVEPTSYRHYLNVQATEDKALAVNRAIKRELEINDDLIAVYGEQKGERWTDGQFVLKNGVVFSCLGAGQSIRGVNYNNIRPDYCVVDDLFDRGDINNPASTREKNEWFWSDLYPALAQFGQVSMHVQGTAINSVDLLMELKGKVGVVWRSFKTVMNWAKKLVIWPEQKTFDQVMAQQAFMPITIWEREFQNQRRDGAASIIKEEWLSSWEYDPTELRKQLREGRDPARLAKKERLLILDTVLLGNDPSIGKKQKSDFTGTALTLVTHWTDAPEEQEFWIEDARELKASVDGRCDQLKKICEARPADSPVNEARIEAIAGFDDYASIAQGRLPVPVTRINHVLDKLTNLENKSLPFQKGRVHLNAKLPLSIKQTVKEQLTTNEPPHDDVRDAILLTIDVQRKGPGMWVIE